MPSKKLQQTKQADNKVMTRFKDFSGGLNDNNSPNLLNDNEVSELENFTFDDKGVLKTRGGLVARYASSLGEEIVGMYPYYKKDGTTRLILGTKNALYYDLPRHVTKYDTKSEFEAGALVNAQCSTDGKVTIFQPTVAFARDAKASNGDGTEADVNIPRYKDIQYSYTESDLSTGTLEDTVYSTTLKLGSPTPPVNKAYTNDADFIGTKTGVVANNNALELHSTGTQINLGYDLHPTVANINLGISDAGGRKIVRLSNGWLVAGVMATVGTYTGVKLFKCTDEGKTWVPFCALQFTSAAGGNYFALVSRGTTVQVLMADYNTAKTYYKSVDVPTTNNVTYTYTNMTTVEINNPSVLGSGCSVAVSQDGTKIGAVWTVKISTYFNSCNLRYREGTFNADGTVTWGSIVQVTKMNVTGYDNINPNLVFYNNMPRIIYQASVTATGLTVGLWVTDGSGTWGSDGRGQSLPANNAYQPYSPCACVLPNGEIHVVWYSYDATTTTCNNIYHSKSTDGGLTWAAQDGTSSPGYNKITTEASMGQSQPTITCDKNNNFWIYWQGCVERTTLYEIRSIKFTGTWSAITNVTSSSTGNKTSPQLLLDPALEYTAPLCMYQDAVSASIRFTGKLPTWAAAPSAPTQVEGSAYSVYPAGRIVKLSNGWLATCVLDSMTFRIYVSKDDGKTWAQLCYMVGNQTSASFAICSRGTNIYLIDSAASFVLYWSIDATTVTNTDQYNNKIQIETQTLMGAGCSIKVDSNGVLYATWCSKNTSLPNSVNVRFAKSTNGGTTWTKMDGSAGVDQITSSNTVGNSAQRPTLVLVNGSVIILCQLYTNNSYIVSYRFVTNAWSQSIVASSGSTSYTFEAPSAVTTQNGNIYCFWYGPDSTDTGANNIRWACSLDNGASWSSMGKLTSGNSYHQTYPVACADYNSIHLFFSGVIPIDSGNKVQVRYMKYDGVLWSSIQTLTNHTADVGGIATLEQSDALMPPMVYTDNQTPSVKFMGVSSSLVYDYNGTYESEVIDLSPVGTVQQSSLTYNTTIPSSCTLTFYTSLSTDGGATWGPWNSTASGGSVVPQGTNLANYRLKWRASFNTSSTSVTPTLNDLTLNVNSGYTNSGSRVSPGIVMRVSGKAKTSKMTWVADTPAGTNVTFDVSWDGGTTWLSCTNGGTIPGASTHNLMADTLLVRQTLTTNDLTKTPTVTSFAIAATSALGGVGSTLYMDGAPKNETLTITTANIFNKSLWSIDFMYMPTVSSTAERILWHTLIDAANEYKLSITAEGMIKLSVKSGGVEVVLAGTTAVDAKKCYLITMTGDGTSMKLFVNGAQVGEGIAYTEPAGTLPVNSYIGSKADGTLPMNGLLDAIRWGKRFSTLDDHLVLFNSGNDFVQDGMTLNKMAFNGNLNLGGRSAWTSPVIDIQSISDKTTGVITWGADTTKAGTSVSVLTQYSVDNITWSQLSAATNEGSIIIDDEDAKYVRAVVELNQTGADSPVLDIVTVSFKETSSPIKLSDMSQTSIYTFATYMDKLYISNGVDPLKVWDGTTFADCAGNPPRGRFIALHKNMLFISGDTSNPDRLYYSGIGDPEKWDAAAFIDIRTGQGDNITGLAPYQNNLTVFKASSIHTLQGDGPLSFIVRNVVNDIGCIAPRSIMVMTDSIAFVGIAGVYFYNGFKAVLSSQRLLNTWDTKVNKKFLSQACSIIWDNKLYVAVPSVGSDANDMVLMFDVVRVAWSIFTGWEPTAFIMYKEYNQYYFLVATADGQVHTYDKDYTTDNGTPIVAVVTTKAIDHGALEVIKRYRQLFVNHSNTANLDVFFLVDGVASRSKTLTPVDSKELSSQRVMPSELGVTMGRTVAIRIRSASAPCIIYGLALEAVLKSVRADM